MGARRYLAFDLGAESGRAFLGTLDGGRLDVREIHRFPNAPVGLFGRLHWDVYRLFAEIRRGLKVAAGSCPEGIDGLGLDTWGVDFGLVADDGGLLGLPGAYRDPRHADSMAAFLESFGRERIYGLTGIQFLPFNSVFQLAELAGRSPSPLRHASSILFLPGLFSYLLTGVRVNEATIASTSQLLDPRRVDWSPEILAALGLSPALLGPPLKPGSRLGTLSPWLAAETGLGEIPVAAVASHDTASAVAAVPASGPSWCYISSGTWSLVGIESPRPIITPGAFRLNFTNEGGMEGTTRFLKNVTGLWLLAQCRKAWGSGRPAGYEELVSAAAGATAFRSLVDPDAPDFRNPDDMPAAIREFCRRTRQPVPETPAETARCVLESLALKSRRVLDELGEIVGQAPSVIHIIGGGSRNRLLCRFTAEAAGRPVVAGPAEATALGNILGQALAEGAVGGLAEMRSIVAASVRPERYEPEGGPEWEAAYHRFRALEI